MTKAERDQAADGPEQVKIGEIVDLYRIGIGDNRQAPMHRMWFLTGLGQRELSTIRRDEIDLARCTLTHRRNETGVQGVYWAARVDRAASDALKEATDGRRRIGIPHPQGPADRHQGVRCGAAGVRRLACDVCRRGSEDSRGVTFYSLRRFFGDYATRVGGDAVGDAALAYTAKSIRGKHYSGYRDFARSERRVGVCTRN
jgi:integrase